jgi:hypothetical protein
LRELGVSERGIHIERDTWILMQAVSPRDVAVWIVDKRDAIADPEFRALYLECDTAFDWSPDDPRLPDLAARMRRWTTDRYGKDGARPVADPIIAQLAATSASASSPAWDRLRTIAILREVDDCRGAARKPD